MEKVEWKDCKRSNDLEERYVTGSILGNAGTSSQSLNICIDDFNMLRDLSSSGIVKLYLHRNHVHGISLGRIAIYAKNSVMAPLILRISEMYLKTSREAIVENKDQFDLFEIILRPLQ